METMATTLSKHAEDRLKERNGFPRKAARRMTEKAFWNGLCREDTKGGLRRWVDGVCTNTAAYYDPGRDIRLYGDTCYIYGSDRTLVTVLKIPRSLVKQVKYSCANANNPA